MLKDLVREGAIEMIADIVEGDSENPDVFTWVSDTGDTFVTDTTDTFIGQVD